MYIGAAQFITCLFCFRLLEFYISLLTLLIVFPLFSSSYPWLNMPRSENCFTWWNIVFLLFLRKTSFYKKMFLEKKNCWKNVSSWHRPTMKTKGKIMIFHWFKVVKASTSNSCFRMAKWSNKRLKVPKINEK